jgi:hypothetical protein
MSLSLWIKAIIAVGLVAAMAFAVNTVYQWGYGKADAEHQTTIANLRAEVERQKSRITELELKEGVVTTEVVTVYKDRVKTIKEVETKIVEVIRDVLGPEIDRCSIGPGFISLHNSAASGIAPSNQGVSTGSQGTPSSTKPAEGTTR